MSVLRGGAGEASLVAYVPGGDEPSRGPRLRPGRGWFSEGARAARELVGSGVSRGPRGAGEAGQGLVPALSDASSGLPTLFQFKLEERLHSTISFPGAFPWCCTWSSYVVPGTQIQVLAILY